MSHQAYALEAGRPVGRTQGLRRLTRSLDTLVSGGNEPSVVAARAGVALRAALDDPGLLAPRHCEPAQQRYRPHLVHVHPDGLYSVLSLVWKPGQATPIHDHVCWCVVGVWRGLERETTYDLHEAGDLNPYLVCRRSGIAAPGDVSVLVPPDEDIHRVENCGSGLAISIHVYGDDISVLGSSINREFEEDLVRRNVPVPDAAPLSWRALDRRR